MTFLNWLDIFFKNLDKIYDPAYTGNISLLSFPNLSGFI